MNEKYILYLIKNAEEYGRIAKLKETELTTEELKFLKKTQRILHYRAWKFGVYIPVLETVEMFLYLTERQLQEKDFLDFLEIKANFYKEKGRDDVYVFLKELIKVFKNIDNKQIVGDALLFFYQVNCQYKVFYDEDRPYCIILRSYKQKRIKKDKLSLVFH